MVEGCIFNTPHWIELCGVLHFKFGIYRPGSILGNRWSVVDFDKIIVTKFKKIISSVLILSNRVNNSIGVRVQSLFCDLEEIV